MEINLYDILQEQLLTEDRVSKIQSKVKKTIMASNPNVNWDEQITNHNGKTMPYIQDVCNAFLTKMFGGNFCDVNIELAPHTTDIAFNELNYLDNPDSNEINQLKKIIKYISNNLDENTLQTFNTSSFNDLINTYGEILSDINAEKRNSTALMGNSGNYNGYTIKQIDHFEESEEFYKYTQNLSIPWCLTHMKDMFNSYGSNGHDKIYFIYHEGFENIEEIPNEQPTWNVPKVGKAPYDAYGYSLICIIVDTEGDLTYCTPRWNHEYEHTNDFLTEEEITQLIQADFYQVFVPYTQEEIEERDNSDEFGEEDWTRYICYAPNGFETCYFKDGTLYNMYRNEVADGYWDSDSAIKIGGSALMVELRASYSYDIFTYDNGEVTKAFSEVHDITNIDDFTTDGELGILLGIDKDGDFICCNMDNWYESTVGRGIISYEHLENTIYLLKYEREMHYGIVNWNNSDMEIAYGIIDPNRIEIDSDEEKVYYYEYEDDYDSPKKEDGTFSKKWVRKVIGFNDYESDWEYADEPDEEYEDEEEMAMSESKQKFMSNFKQLTEKLNNIHKRNSIKLID